MALLPLVSLFPLLALLIATAASAAPTPANGSEAPERAAASKRPELEALRDLFGRQARPSRVELQRQATPDETYYGSLAQDFLRHPDRYSGTSAPAPSKTVANGLYDQKMSEPNELFIDFGTSVAGAGDVNDDGYNDVIVGAISSFFGAGPERAYVFFGGPSMDETADLVLSGDGEGMFFGWSVAGAGDLNGDDHDDLIVGAPSWDGPEGDNRGRIYVFYGGPGLDATPDLILEGEEGDFYGYSVAIAGDLSGDDEDDFVVGCGAALYSDDPPVERVEVFYGGPGVDDTADLTLYGEFPLAGFGLSVAGAGDVNGDTHPDLIVGAPGDETGPDEYGGRAYIYFGGPGLDTAVDLLLYGEDSLDYFGWSVAGAGDVNGDAEGDLIIGAPQSFNGGVGRAYVFYGGPNLDATADLTMDGDGVAREFGATVGGIDVNGDMRSDLMVTASSIDRWADVVRRTYIFYGGAGIDDVVDVTLIDPVYDRGYVSAGVEDLDGDGFADVLMGAPVSEHAFVFRGGADMDDVVDWTLQERPDTTGNVFGTSVAEVGDVNGDSWPDVVVGGPGWLFLGRAYLYFGGPDMDSEADVILEHFDFNSEGLGSSVAAAGDVNGDTWPDVIVTTSDGFSRNAYIYFGGPAMDGIPDVTLPGSWDSVAGGADVNGDTYADVVLGDSEVFLLGFAGIVNVYFGGPDMDATPDLSLTAEESFDGFGHAVEVGNVNGDAYADILVGSPNYNSSTGRVYVYYGGSTPDEIADLTIEGEGEGHGFGFSVAVIEGPDGDVYDDVVVGAPWLESNTGKAYVLEGGAPMDGTPDLLLSSPASGSFFGYTVAASRDLSADSQPDLLVAAPGFDSETGRVLVYHGGSALDDVPDSVLDGEEAGDLFGFSLAGLGDVNADLGGDMIVGAPNHGDNGAAYLFYGESPPAFTKTFTPDVTGVGVATTLTFTIDNGANSEAATALGFIDELPPGLASSGVPSTTCADGTLFVVGGANIVYFGGTVNAGESCTVQVDVVAATTGTFENVSNPLTSSLGTSLPARDILLVEPAPTFLKSFSPNKIAVGGLSTLIFTVDNTASSAAATNLAFTDNLPTALVVATPANVVNGCDGTPTAVAGSGVISLSGGTVGAGSTCTLKVDVTSTAVGDHVNVTGDLTSSLGNSGPATDTLRVNPPPSLDVTFDSSSILVGGISTLTLEFDNSGSTVAALDLAVTDNFPTEILVADPANSSNDCGGVLTAAPGSSLVTLADGSVAAGARCSVSVDVTSDVLGAHLNVTNAPTSTLGSSDPAEATLTVEDLAAPVVTAVTTSSGDLHACDNLRDPVRTIHVTIEDDRTPLLGADEAANYRLVASGADGDFSTANCSGVAGDDVAIDFGATAVQQPPLGDGPVVTDVTLTMVDPDGLARGLYRLFVCDTVTDSAGNALDGDGDATPGGDFEISSFRVDPFNLLINGHFDDCSLSLDPWEAASTPPSVIETGEVEADDVENSSLSASARIAQSDVPSSQISQCVPVSGDAAYRLEYWLRYDAPAGGTGILIAGCEFFDAAACAGGWLDEHVVGSLLEDGGGTWWLGEQEFLSPETAVSARCGAEAEPAGTDPFFDLYLDGLFFGLSDPLQIFLDGFESGDLSAWSTATP